jgi:hypothetical protein
MSPRHPDVGAEVDFFDDSKAYRDGDIIAMGYAKARSTIKSWEDRYDFPRGYTVGRTRIRPGRELNAWDRARRLAQKSTSV